MGDRELEVTVWLEATLAYGNPVFISPETHALLQRRLQDARTMKPFAEMFRVADSGLGLLGREPAVCIGAFPIAAHLERPAQKNRGKKGAHPQD